MARAVLHVDLDQFIAAVEVLRRPELRGKPVVVGGEGDPTKRGVVSTASYEAREYGVRSGMPLRTAVRKCPDAVFLPVDSDAYAEASVEVMAALRSMPAVVETAGWDEAFMAIEGGDPEGFARQVQRVVLERTRLWCSIGVGDNKLRAKLASDMAKPAGVYRLTRGNWAEVMQERPVDALWGIGSKTRRRLAEIGVDTVAQLAAADEDELASEFGPNTGPWLRVLATGEDAAPVRAESYVRRSRGRERTFQEDLADAADVRREVGRLADELARELTDESRAVARVVVKVRFAPFFTSTHGVTIAGAMRDPAALRGAASLALERFALDRPVRLVGVRVEFER
jgi:DNA polymerase-4